MGFAQRQDNVVRVLTLKIALFNDSSAPRHGDMFHKSTLPSCPFKSIQLILRVLYFGMTYAI